jgi:hypothetical protein
MTELPRDTIPERDPADDSHRRKAHRAEKASHVINIALLTAQFLGALAAGAWAVSHCVPRASGLEFLAGFGLAAATIAGYGAAQTLSWLWALLSLPRLFQWLNAPAGVRAQEDRVDRVFRILLPTVAISVCLASALAIAGVLALLVPTCTIYPLWLRLLGAAMLVSIPTPRLLDVVHVH